MEGRAGNKINNNNGGVALIIVIWIVIILVAIAGEFSYSMRTEINITKNFKQEEEAYQLALAGIEYAKAELLAEDNPGYVYLNDSGILTVSKDEGTDREKDLGRGSFKYTITDEESKLNINTASQAQLKHILIMSGVDPSDADTITDSIMDWRDSDDLHMLNGAEEDYYRSQKIPYSSKDGFFEVLEELLLVKGMTKDIFYGLNEKDGQTVYEGISKYLGVRGTGQVNVNTASEIVLEAALGTRRSEDIVRMREQGPVTGSVAGGKVSSEIFTVVSTGRISDDKISRTVKAVIIKKQKHFETVYWNDNITG